MHKKLNFKKNVVIVKNVYFTRTEYKKITGANPKVSCITGEKHY